MCAYINTAFPSWPPRDRQSPHIYLMLFPLLGLGWLQPCLHPPPPPREEKSNGWASLFGDPPSHPRAARLQKVKERPRKKWNPFWKLAPGTGLRRPKLEGERNQDGCLLWCVCVWRETKTTLIEPKGGKSFLNDGEFQERKTFFLSRKSINELERNGFWTASWNFLCAEPADFGSADATMIRLGDARRQHIIVYEHPLFPSILVFAGASCSFAIVVID